MEERIEEWLNGLRDFARSHPDEFIAMAPEHQREHARRYVQMVKTADAWFGEGWRLVRQQEDTGDNS
jgi:hypothetical protein